MNAALPASTTLVPAPADGPALPAGLTYLDASGITAASAASMSEMTRTVYGHVWRQWERWCAVRGETLGALFTRIWASTISLEPLSRHVVARMLCARAEAAGLDGTRITARSEARSPS